MKNRKKIISLALAGAIMGVFGAGTSFAADRDISKDETKYLHSEYSKNTEKYNNLMADLATGSYEGFTFEYSGSLFDFLGLNDYVQKAENVNKSFSDIMIAAKEVDGLVVGEVPAQKKKCETLLYKLAA